MTIYSHSRLSTFEQCPLKFKFRYIERIEPDFKQTIEGFLGNQVHETLEWIYNNEKRETLELDLIIQNFIQNWNKGFHQQIKIVKQDNNAEDYFNKGIKFLINYFLSNSPFKDNTLETEKRIIIDLNGDGEYKLQGYIDRLVHNKDTNTFEIHDYKTSASLKSQEELDKDRQLALYSIAIKKEFNPTNIDLIWHFLDFNKKIISKRTDEQLENLKKELIIIIKKIESETEFQANQTPLCNWCEFKSKCPKIQQTI